MNFEQNKEYELAYWRKMNREAAINRYVSIVSIMNLPSKLHGCQSVIDLGCGPYGGIFNLLQFPEMIAIDPLWPEYDQDGISDFMPHVLPITGDSNNFEYSKKVDAIVSINALDHSGSFERSVSQVASHLNDGGKFIMHMHMRRTDQLNAGHKQSFDRIQVLKAINEAGLILRLAKIYPECPFDNKPYESIIGEWVKI